jgi:DNA-binding winged helix-turn-helix (wHTH) protein
LQKKLWPGDTFVDFEHGLNTAVKKLREALGDSADNPRFVETLARRGYRFIYPVAAASSPPESVAPLSPPAKAVDSLLVVKGVQAHRASGCGVSAWILGPS